MLCRKETVPQMIPSWTDFQILVQGNIMTLKISVGYLDSIDAPATDISIINGVLLPRLEIKDSLHLESVVCVFDEAIYAKAAQIKYNNPEKFKPCVLMLGIFHTLMMYFQVLLANDLEMKTVEGITLLQNLNCPAIYMKLSFSSDRF